MNAEDIQKALRKKGFQKKEGGKHTKYILYVDGKKTRVMTIFSRGKDKKELGDDLIKRIMKQLHFNKNKDKFRDFVKCPMTHEDYLQMLRDKNVI